MPFIKLEDHRLHYRQRGQGPLLLILPGATASSANHHGELAYFGQRYHAIALDYWGVGQSDRLLQWPDYYWQQAARDAARLIQHLGYGGCIAVGTSAGGAVALYLALSFPSLVRAVVSDSIVAKLPPARLREEVASRRRRTPEQVGFWQRAHGDDWEAVVEADNDLMLRFADAGGDWFAGRLPEVRCPVLFTASLHDELLFEVGPQLCGMVEQVPDSRLHLARDGSHPLMWSRPGEFRRAAGAFLDEVQAREADRGD